MKISTIIRKLLGFFVKAALIVGIAYGGYLYLFVFTPVGSGPAGPFIPPKYFKSVWTERKVVFVGLGDSITAGFGASEGLSYFDRLVKNPGSDSEDIKGKNLSVVVPNIVVENLAVSGSTSIDCLERQVPSIAPTSSDVLGLVVITTGGNDIIHQYGKAPPREGAMYGATFDQAKPWIANYKKRLDTIIQCVNDRFPGGCHIFLANIYDPTDGTGDPGLSGLPLWPDALKIIDAYNSVIAGCPGKYSNVHIVNIHDPFLGHGLHATKFWLKHYHLFDPHYWFNANIEDPNDRGYDALRRIFLLRISEVFEVLRRVPTWQV